MLVMFVPRLCAAVSVCNLVCYAPLIAYRSAELTATGKRGIVFSPTLSHSGLMLKLPCGQCVGCRLERSRQWAVRCMHENKCHDTSVFLTLTYDDDHLPDGGSLVKRDLQLFMKRVRKARDSPVRFYGCGEYGDTTYRPHYHVLLFGTDFADKRYHTKSKSGEPLFTSNELSELWPVGVHSIGAVTFESAAYCARYVMKKITGDLAADHYEGREPEFVNMSRRPGIGAPWLEKYGSEVYTHDSVIVRGIEARPPRFYDNKYELVDAGRMELVRKARRSATCGGRFHPDNTPARRFVRETVANAKVNLYNRDV